MTDCSRMIRGILAASHISSIEQLPLYVARRTGRLASYRSTLEERLAPAATKTVAAEHAPSV
ncbi:hypothetical protein [Streptomyces flaveolus]|uniref:hypothetical protein n=1 Tax=Streptomyces flaveolus TaxID=67297 RepID=UPI0036F57D10